MSTTKAPVLTDSAIRDRDKKFKDLYLELEDFLNKHPEYAITFSVLISTVCRCADSHMNIGNVRYQNAYDHMDTCAWCKNNYELDAKRRLDGLARA
jgi:hypothetical protein